MTLAQAVPHLQNQLERIFSISAVDIESSIARTIFCVQLGQSLENSNGHITESDVDALLLRLRCMVYAYGLEETKRMLIAEDADVSH